MKIAFLITKNHRLLSLVAAVDLFGMVRQSLLEITGNDELEFRFIGLDDRFPLAESWKDIPYESVHSGISTQDILFIPAFADKEMERNIADNIRFIPFLHQQFQQGSALASL